jgi:hypothetical protein
MQYGLLLFLGNIFAILAEWIISNNREAPTSLWNRAWLAHASVTFVVVLAACINWYRKTERQNL